MIYSTTIEGVAVQTGDLLCNNDGAHQSLYGSLWHRIGSLMPGVADHVAMYVGPGVRCVESGPFGVITYEMPEGRWDAKALLKQRGFLDTFHGVVSPVETLPLSANQKRAIREGVAAYCLAQAEANKPYNFNVLKLSTNKAFYCSQLAYKAYALYGINLHTQPTLFDKLHLPVIFPDEIWNGPWNRREVAQGRDAATAY